MRDLLAKHTPINDADGNGALEEHQGATGSVDSIHSEAVASRHCTAEAEPLPEVKSTQAVANGTAMATRAQLRKMGIDVDSPCTT